MENTTETTPKNENNAFDFDKEFSFQAINTGLGFHQPKKTFKKKKPQIKKTIPVQKSISTPPSVVYTKLNNTFDQPKSKIRIKAKTAKNKFRTATRAEQFTSWIIDCSIILLTMACSTYLITMLSGLPPKEVFTLLPKEELFSFLIILFSCFYIIYFTILDVSESSTIGKKLLGLNLKEKGDLSSDQNCLNIYQVFFRTLLTLSSVFMLGIPLLFHIQEKLSNTQLVKKN